MSPPFSLRAELKGVDVAEGMTLRYWEAGAGRVLVMLPGLGHAASLYKYQLEGLCDEFRVIALDPRGHGESDKPQRGYNYHTLAKDLDGFLRALDLDDVTILGHSGGCKVILTYLELYGDSRLRAIVFSDDSPCHLRDGIFSADQALAAIDAFQGPDAIAFSKRFSDQFLTDDAEESAKEAFYRRGSSSLVRTWPNSFVGPPSVIGGMRMRWSRCPLWSLADVYRRCQLKLRKRFTRPFPALPSSSLKLTKAGATRCSGKVPRSTTTHCARS